MKRKKWIPSPSAPVILKWMITVFLRETLHTISSASSKVNLLVAKKNRCMPDIATVFHIGTKGQPSFARLYKYPNFSSAGLIASKSFFQGDHVEMKWNSLGNSVLLMTSTDVDTSGASYYGKQTLHFLDAKGTSAMVQLSMHFGITRKNDSLQITNFHLQRNRGQSTVLSGIRLETSFALSTVLCQPKPLSSIRNAIRNLILEQDRGIQSTTTLLEIISFFYLTKHFNNHRKPILLNLISLYNASFGRFWQSSWSGGSVEPHSDEENLCD